MKITTERFSSKSEEVTFIVLTQKEVKELAKDLVSHVGEKATPKRTIERLTNQLADLFLEEDK